MILRRVALMSLAAYRVTLSPILYGLGVRCRYAPSCSAYAAEAFRRHSPRRALRLSIGRVCRCRPGGGHGYDPVPPA